MRNKAKDVKSGNLSGKTQYSSLLDDEDGSMKV